MRWQQHIIGTRHITTIIQQSRIERYCGRCDYRWHELPLDHDQEAENEMVKAAAARFREEWNAKKSAA